MSILDSLLLSIETDGTPKQLSAAAECGATLVVISENAEVPKVCSVPILVKNNIEKAALADGAVVSVSDVKAARSALGQDKAVGAFADSLSDAKKAQSDGADFVIISTDCPTKNICGNISIPAAALVKSESDIRHLHGSGICGISARLSDIDVPQKLRKAAMQAIMQGAIFDMDGTLIDSMPYWENVACDFLKGLGITPEPGLTETVQSMSLKESSAYMRDEYALSMTDEEIIDGINKTIASYYYNDITLKTGILDMLRAFDGVKKYVCTLTPPDLSRAVLERNGILKYFDGVLSAVDCGLNKSSPKIYELALKKLGTPKKYTYIFEDSDYAAMTAKAGGFTVVGVSDAHTPRENIEDFCDFYTVDYEDWK